MATARKSSVDEDDDSDDDRRKDLEQGIRELQSAKKELFEKSRSTDEELVRIAQREREFIDEQNRLKAERHDREQERRAVKRLIEVESELKRVKCENVKLKQSLDQATKHSKAQLHKISELKSHSQARSETPDSSRSTVTELENHLSHTTKLLQETKEQLTETRQHLSDVQERLTVAEQVTAATQQRALQESGNDSGQLQLELTPQHQQTTHTGLVSQLLNILVLLCVMLKTFLPMSVNRKASFFSRVNSILSVTGSIWQA